MADLIFRLRYKTPQPLREATVPPLTHASDPLYTPAAPRVQYESPRLRVNLAYFEQPTQISRIPLDLSSLSGKSDGDAVSVMSDRKITIEPDTNAPPKKPRGRLMQGLIGAGIGGGIGLTGSLLGSWGINRLGTHYQKSLDTTIQKSIRAPRWDSEKLSETAQAGASYIRQHAKRLLAKGLRGFMEALGGHGTELAKAFIVISTLTMASFGGLIGLVRGGKKEKTDS